MAREKIPIPDDLHIQAKQAELDAFLAELEAELGPTSDMERAEAKEWADRVLGATPHRQTG